MNDEVRWHATKRPRRWAGALLLAALFGGVILVVAYRTYLGRASTYLMMDDILDVEWYDPAEQVLGEARAPLVAVDPADSGIAVEALQRARDFAKGHGSCAYLVLHRGLVADEQYWCQLKPDDKPQAMSMAKTVTALLVGKAVAEGKIASIADPVSTYLPEWAGDSRSRIRIEDLLRMHSGLRNEDNPWNPFSDIVRIHIGTDVPEAAFSVPAMEPPGQRFDYNNVNFQILGLLLERVYEERFAHLLSEKLWRPLGAADALVWLDRPGGTAKTYCCLFAQARDWARLGWMMARRGKVGSQEIVPADWIDTMLKPSAIAHPYGMGVWLNHPSLPGQGRSDPEPFLREDLFLLVGQGQQRVYVIPSAELVIVRLGHEGENWDDAVIPNTLLRGMEGYSED